MVFIRAIESRLEHHITLVATNYGEAKPMSTDCFAASHISDGFGIFHAIFNKKIMYVISYVLLLSCCVSRGEGFLVYFCDKVNTRIKYSSW